VKAHTTTPLQSILKGDKDKGN